MQIVYIVVEEGVYRHDIWGPFFTFEEAKEKANAIVAGEENHSGFITGNRNDGYHQYHVYSMGGGVLEGNPLYTVKGKRSELRGGAR